MNNSETSMRDRLRSITLGANPGFKREKVKIGEDEFELIQPTQKQRGDFRKAAMKVDIKDSKTGQVAADFDIYEFQIQAVIGLTVIPGTDERVFDESDRAVIEACPAGGWFDDLASVATKLCNVTDSDAKKD